MDIWLLVSTFSEPSLRLSAAPHLCELQTGFSSHSAHITEEKAEPENTALHTETPGRSTNECLARRPFTPTPSSPASLLARHRSCRQHVEASL
ncbi:hypothetical protein PBY51_013889 [Eleginops maclovinus]|uniref:Uncharacterized protein n=1 Tax=Eleginops maclovinus TaxID=56733 RepID=A0AAN8ABW0_ELEMC|nr:hypothetical protein PBY51_013889 [Eleginops maclovinus]